MGRVSCRVWSVSIFLLLLLLLCASPVLSQQEDEEEELSVMDEDEEVVAADDAPALGAASEGSVPIIPQPPPPVDSDPAIPALLSYLSNHGVDHSAVRVADTVRGRGLLAARALAAGSTFLSLPSSVLVSADYISSKSQLAPLLPNAQIIDAFAAWLAYNRNNSQSAHRAFIASLPPFVPLPIFYAPSVAVEYKGTTLEEIANNRRGVAYTVYSRFSEDVRHRVSKADFIWGLTILWSRAFSMAVRDAQGDGGWRSVAVLVPLADMLNTGNSTQLNVRCKTGKGSKSFDCQALRDVSEGEELLVSYGPKSDAQLLHDYGLVLGHNPHDFVMIRLPSPKSNKTKGDSHKVAFRKMEVEDQLNREAGRTEPVLSFRLTAPSNWSSLEAVVPADALGWARLNVIGQQDTASITAYEMIDRMRHGREFSKRNTLLAAKLLVKHIRQAIRRYPTTAEQDYALLTEDNGRLMRENQPLFGIVVVRWGEKALLHDISDWLQKAQPRMEKEAEDEKEQRRRDWERRQQEKKEKEERERQKKLEKERQRREEDARAARRQQEEDALDELDTDDVLLGSDPSSAHSDGLRRAMRGQPAGAAAAASSRRDELRRA